MHYAKWNKTEKRQMLPDFFTCKWNLKTKQNQSKTHRYREQSAGWQKGVEDKMGENDQEVQTCSYKVSHGDV